MRNILKILFFVFSVSYVPANLFGQLVGKYNNASRSTNIYIDNKADTIYIFNASGANLFTKKGTLEAISPDSTKGWKFIWEQYNLKIKDYVKFDSISGDSISIKDTLSSGAYRVIMEKGVIDTFRAWIFINQLRLNLKKDSKGEVPELTYFCKYLPLGVIESTNQRYDSTLRFIHNNLVYANPLKKNFITIPNTTNVEWTASPSPEDPLDSTFSNDRLQIFINNAPVKNTTFTINFKDMFGNTATDNVHYTTQNTKADFDILFYDPASKSYLKLDTTNLPDTLDAPLKAKFKNNSKRGIKFEWFVADTFLNYNTKDSAHYIKTDSSNSGSYTYYRPYTYKIRLISTSPEGCTDTSAYHKIKVADSELGKDSLRFPNAFTPGLHNNNEFFTYKADSWHSVRNLHLMVFSQWGKLVYEYNAPVNYGWEGWNGNIGNSQASPGIYFYKYEAIGWGHLKHQAIQPI